MLLNITQAASAAGVSRRTFYNHIEQKGISTTTDQDGSKKVDLSELERIYGKEVVSQNLKDIADENESGVSARETTRASSQGGVQAELQVLKERLKGLEESKSQLENFNRREREQFTEQIENLRESLKKSQDQQSQLGLLLTDQRTEREKRDGANDRKIDELEKELREIRKINRSALRALKQEREKGFWQRLFG